MKRPIRMSDPAAAELYEAVGWYERQRPGLGADLFDAISHTLSFIESNPEAGVAVSADSQTRRFMVRRFPYQVVYRIRTDEIVIVAVAHSKRRPGYWTDRRPT